MMDTVKKTSYILTAVLVVTLLVISVIAFVVPAFAAIIPSNDDLPQLPTPQNVRIENSRLLWDTVDNAVGYIFYITYPWGDSEEALITYDEFAVWVESGVDVAPGNMYIGLGGANFDYGTSIAIAAAGCWEYYADSGFSETVTHYIFDAPENLGIGHSYEGGELRVTLTWEQ